MLSADVDDGRRIQRTKRQKNIRVYIEQKTKTSVYRLVQNGSPGVQTKSRHTFC